jgi:hypothetical protein
MSKHWRYEVWIPAAHNLSVAQRKEIIELTQAHGYRPVQGFRTLPSDEWQEVMLNSRDVTVTWLGELGGVLQLHKGPDDWPTEIEMSLPDAPGHYERRDSLLAFNEVVLYVGDYNYRYPEEEEDRLQTASDVQALYCDLCTYLDAPYGAAWSNYDYEEVIRDLHTALYGQPEPAADDALGRRTFQALMDGERFYAEVSSGRPPSALFSLQYFSNEYARSIDLATCVELGAKIRNLPHGVLVKFFDYPWNVGWRPMLMINQQWRSLHPDMLQL